MVSGWSRRLLFMQNCVASGRNQVAVALSKDRVRVNKTHQGGNGQLAKDGEAAHQKSSERSRAGTTPTSRKLARVPLRRRCQQTWRGDNFALRHGSRNGGIGECGLWRLWWEWFRISAVNLKADEWYTMLSFATNCGASVNGCDAGRERFTTCRSFGDRWKRRWKCRMGGQLCSTTRRTFVCCLAAAVDLWPIPRSYMEERRTLGIKRWCIADGWWDNIPLAERDFCMRLSRWILRCWMVRVWLCACYGLAQEWSMKIDVMARSKWYSLEPGTFKEFLAELHQKAGACLQEDRYNRVMYRQITQGLTLVCGVWRLPWLKMKWMWVSPAWLTCRQKETLG